MEEFKTIKYQNDEKEIDIYLQNEDKSIWLSQKGIATLFSVTSQAVVSHLKNINELLNFDPPTSKKIWTVRDEGARKVRRKIKLYSGVVIEEIGRRKHSENFEKIKEFVANYLKESSLSLLSNENIIIYDNGTAKVSLNVSYEEQTVWASQKEIAEVFSTSVPDINYHIKRILEEGELDPTSVIKCHLNTGPDGKNYNVTVYNLDMILAVGFRVSTKKATRFRRWAAGILSQYMVKGYAINEPRCLECQNAIIGLQNRVLRSK